jgi:hypothetical protein
MNALMLVVPAADLFDNPVILDTVSWGLIAGVLTPLLTSLAQQPKWSSRRRAVVGAAVSVLVGILTCLLNGDLGNGQTVLSTIAAVLVASMTTYKGLWKPTGVAGGIETATSPGTTGDGDARHAA